MFSIAGSITVGVIVVVGVVAAVTRYHTRRQQAVALTAEAQTHDASVVVSDLVRILRH